MGKASSMRSKFNTLHDIFFAGSVKVKGVKIPKLTIIGVLGVVLMYVSVVGIVSVSSPWWLGKGDAPRHIDYVSRIYSGEIPKFTDGIQYEAFRELSGSRKGVYPIDNQPAASHPPLFYAIHAPLMGPLLESGDWKMAIGVGRAVNIFIGILTIGALAWAGWLFGGRRRALLAVATPAFGAMLYQFTALNVNFANDILLVLLTSLCVIVSYYIINNGVTKLNISMLALISALGMATKVSYIVYLFASLLAVMAAVFLHSKKETIKKFIIGAVLAAGVLVVVAVAIGWFYYMYNYKEAGSLLSQSPKGYLSEHREYKSLPVVLASKELWSLLYSSFTPVLRLSVFMSGVVVGGYLSMGDAIKKVSASKLIKNKVFISVMLLIVIPAAGTFLTQIFHGVGYGGFQFRYMLPAIVSIALFLAYGLLAFNWARGMVAAIFLFLMAISTIFISSKSNPDIPNSENFISRLMLAPSSNGIPEIIPILLLILIIPATVLLFWSLFRLTSSKYSNR